MTALTANPVVADPLNWTRYVPGQKRGHYESFYQRANHPTRPLAFWIRYTMVSPAGRPDAAIGELWAAFFNGETGEHLVTKEEYPIAACDFAADDFAVRIGNRTLGPDGLTGACGGISWNLTYSGTEQPLLLLPDRMYRGSFPKAKSLVGLPLAVYRGRLRVNGSVVTVKDWVGSQNHNWGSKHTDSYAWGQVAGFDGEPGAFLECSTARLKLGDAYVRTKDGNGALREFTRAADLLPKSVEAQVKAGSYLLLASSYEDAKSRADRALEIEPKNTDAQILRGNALAGLKDFNGAVSTYEEAIALDPTKYQGYLVLGTIQYLQGKRDELQRVLDDLTRRGEEWRRSRIRRKSS